MTAVIDGQAWTSGSAGRYAQVGNFGLIQIQGNHNNTVILLQLYNVDSVGTYSLGVSGTNVGGYGQVTDLLPRGWATPLSGAAGSITLTTLTNTRIAGTFTFTADSSLGSASGSRVVTQGSFDLLLGFSGSTTWPLPDEYGSSFAGTIGGGAWNSATTVMTLLNTTLVIGANNTSYSISIGLTSFNGTGSYTVGSQPGEVVVVLQGPAVNPTGPLNCCWGGALGNTGTLTITSLTATRIAGNLTATLVPTPGTAASGTISLDTDFDIGIP